MGIGIGLMVLPLPMIALTQAVDAGAASDVLQTIGLAAPGVGFPVLAIGRLRRRVSVEGDDAYPARFGRAPRLRGLGGFGAALLGTSYLVILGVAVLMLILAGLAAAIAHSSFNLDEQPMGVFGDGMLAFGLSTMGASLVWLVLGVLLYGGLATGYSLRLLLSGSTSGEDKTAAGMVLLALLMVLGVVALVVTGNGGVPAHPRAVRGAIATGGAVVLLGGIGLAVAIAWRRRIRPWDAPSTSRGPDGWLGVVVRSVAALILLGWLVAALISAWGP
jgi:hypothetical protein